MRKFIALVGTTVASIAIVVLSASAASAEPNPGGYGNGYGNSIWSISSISGTDSISSMESAKVVAPDVMAVADCTRVVAVGVNNSNRRAVEYGVGAGTQTRLLVAAGGVQEWTEFTGFEYGNTVSVEVTWKAGSGGSIAQVVKVPTASECAASPLQ